MAALFRWLVPETRLVKSNVGPAGGTIAAAARSSTTEPISRVLAAVPSRITARTT